MNHLIITGILSACVVSAGLNLGRQAEQIVQDHSQRQAQAYCQAGLTSACQAVYLSSVQAQARPE